MTAPVLTMKTFVNSGSVILPTHCPLALKPMQYIIKGSYIIIGYYDSTDALIRIQYSANSGTSWTSIKAVTIMAGCATSDCVSIEFLSDSGGHFYWSGAWADTDGKVHTIYYDKTTLSVENSVTNTCIAILDCWTQLAIYRTSTTNIRLLRTDTNTLSGKYLDITTDTGNSWGGMMKVDSTISALHGYILYKSTDIYLKYIHLITTVPHVESTTYQWTTTQWGSSTLSDIPFISYISSSMNNLVYLEAFSASTLAIVTMKNIFKSGFTYAGELKRIKIATTWTNCSVSRSFFGSYSNDIDGIYFQLSSNDKIYSYRCTIKHSFVKGEILPASCGNLVVVGEGILRTDTYVFTKTLQSQKLLTPTIYSGTTWENTMYYHDQMVGDKLRLSTDENFPIESGESLQFYDGSSIIVDAAYDIQQSNPADNLYVMISNEHLDLKKKISVNFVAMKSNAMINAITETYCDYLADTAIADGSFVAWNYEKKDAEIANILQDIMAHEVQMILINRSTKAMTLLADPLTGSATLRFDFENINDPDVELISYIYSEVHLTGKWDILLGDWTRAYWLNSDAITNAKILSDAYPKLELTDLQAMANAIGEQRQNDLRKVTLEIYDSNWFNYGDVIELCFPIKKIGTEVSWLDDFDANDIDDPPADWTVVDP